MAMQPAPKDQQKVPQYNIEAMTVEWEIDTTVQLEEHTSNHNKSEKANIDETDHSKKGKVAKTRRYYQDPSQKDAAKLIAGSAVGSVVEAYVVDLAIQQVFMNTIGAELAYAAGIGAWAGPLGAGLGAVGVLAYCGYNHWCNKAEAAKLTAKKGYNAKVELFNTKLTQMKTLEAQIIDLRQKLAEQEEKLNNETFQVERYVTDSKVMVAVGPTGYGKSLFCNRMIGNEQDIEHLEESKETPFKVAEYGKTKSETTKIKKKVSKVHLSQEGDDEQLKQTIRLSVVDTPGFFDSKGRDEHFSNNMAEYFRASGGVNMFCIFFKFGEKIDKNYQKLIAEYQKFWGTDLWKHSVIIITRCDMDGNKNKKRTERGLPSTIEEIRQFLKKASNGLCGEIPVYPFGEENFEESTKKLLVALVDKSAQNPYQSKYRSRSITSPMDELWAKLRPLIKEHAKLARDLNALVEDLKRLKDETK